MKKRLGWAYYGCVGVVVAAGAATVLTAASAETEPTDVDLAVSGYGIEATLPIAANAHQQAVDVCVEAASERFDENVSLAQVNRVHRGSEGWIVDLSVDVLREGKRPRRRDVGCRQGSHGLQVARY